MNRRRFLLASGSAIMSGTSVSNLAQEPIVGLSFDIQTVQDSTPQNIESLKIEFKSIDLTPRYIDDTKEADVSVEMDLEKFGVHEESVSVELTNGVTTDVSNYLNSVTVDDINASNNDFIQGDVTVKIDHPSIKESWTQNFSYSQSVPNSDGGDDVVEKSINGDTYRLHIFNNNGTFSIDSDYNNAYILVVGGGGGGGQGEGGGAGGGGGGGVALAEGYNISQGSYSITVGSGGIGGDQFDGKGEEGNRGDDSYFYFDSSNIQALGGGGGAAANEDTDGTDGGSGGGSADFGGSPGGSAGSGNQPGTNNSEITDYGNDGGQQDSNNTGAGGGGAVEQGKPNPSYSSSGDGGDGVDLSDIFGTTVGENGGFGGGGGGSSDGVDAGGSAGSGGIGGGGKGTDGNSNRENGLDGTGGGGGGGTDNWGYGRSGRSGGDGGKGVVIVRLGPL